MQTVFSYLSWCDDQDPWIPPTFEGLVAHAASKGPVDKDTWATLQYVWNHRAELSQ